MSETLDWLYRLQPTRLGMVTEGPTPEEAALVSAHFDYLKELAQHGVLLLAGRTLTNDERTFGIAIFRAPSEEAARQIVDADPAVRGGVMRAELFPYRIAVFGAP